jgi:hypothetical protein
MARAATRVLAATSRLFRTAGADVTDRALLARFASERDEQAFAELVERHGPMVHATCRRLLNDPAAALQAVEDGAGGHGRPSCRRANSASRSRMRSPRSTESRTRKPA